MKNVESVFSNPEFQMQQARLEKLAELAELADTAGVNVEALPALAAELGMSVEQLAAIFTDPNQVDELYGDAAGEGEPVDPAMQPQPSVQPQAPAMPSPVAQPQAAPVPAQDPSVDMQAQKIAETIYHGRAWGQAAADSLLERLEKRASEQEVSGDLESDARQLALSYRQEQEKTASDYWVQVEARAQEMLANGEV
jgi:hypothetical protein